VKAEEPNKLNWESVAFDDENHFVNMEMNWRFFW